MLNTMIVVKMKKTNFSEWKKLLSNKKTTCNTKMNNLNKNFTCYIILLVVFVL